MPFFAADADIDAIIFVIVFAGYFHYFAIISLPIHYADADVEFVYAAMFSMRCRLLAEMPLRHAAFSDSLIAIFDFRQLPLMLLLAFITPRRRHYAFADY
jgi:hypothetical protein